MSDGELIESLLRSKKQIGFVLPKTPLAKERPNVPETKPLNLKDFGLVPLTQETIDVSGYKGADIVLSETGIPIQDPDQVLEQRDRRNYNKSSGKYHDPSIPFL